MKCIGCGASIYDDANRCQYCGAYQPASAHQYHQQGYQQPQYQQQPQYYQPTPVVVNVQNTNVNHSSGRRGRVEYSSKSRGTALLLCILLGYFGAHKFYVGKTGAGILYLCTLGLFCVGWIVDIFSIASGASTDKWGRKVR